MDCHRADIHTLLQDITDNYGVPEPEQLPQPPIPYSRHIPTPYESQAVRPMLPVDDSTPICKPQPVYGAQSSNLPSTHSHTICNDSGLDAYGSCLDLEIIRRLADCSPDRALLAEPQPHSGWQTNSSTLPARRVSLPGHTAPSSPVNVFQRSKAQRLRRGRSRGVLRTFRC